MVSSANGSKQNLKLRERKCVCREQLDYISLNAADAAAAATAAYCFGQVQFFR